MQIDFSCQRGERNVTLSSVMIIMKRIATQDAGEREIWRSLINKTAILSPRTPGVVVCSRRIQRRSSFIKHISCARS